MDPQKNVVSYVPFKTFLAALEALERGVPNQLDRSVWPSYSGAIQGQLLGAFRFLGLVDENQSPTPAMRELAANRDRRPTLLRRLLEQRYASLIALDLTRTSPRQLDEAMRKYGLTGATHRKAVSFFLQAARYADLPISALLKAKTRTSGVPRRRASGTAASETKMSADAGAPMSKTVKLRSGGAVTLTASFDVFGLAADDRAFVFDLIDRMQKYGRG